MIEKGFTLIEVLIAVSVFSVVLVAINRSLSSVIENRNRYEAFYYF